MSKLIQAKSTDTVSAAVVATALHKEATPILKKLQANIIKDNFDYNMTAQRVSQLKELAKQAREKESSIITPLKKAIKEIQSLFSPFLHLIEDGEKNAKAEMIAFLHKMEMEKEKINEQLVSGKIAKVSTAVRKLEALEIKSADSSVRKVWVLVETDATLTPREYLVPDETRIKEALKAGKIIPGWRMEQQKIIAI